jgi:hypothetical protein
MALRPRHWIPGIGILMFSILWPSFLPKVVSPATLTASTADEQRVALISFANATGGSLWVNPWPPFETGIRSPQTSSMAVIGGNTESDHCSWFGVQCCPANCGASCACQAGLVTGLVLPANGVRMDAWCPAHVCSSDHTHVTACNFNSCQGISALQQRAFHPWDTASQP